MKLFITLFVIAFSTETCPELEQTNQDLRISVQSLRSQIQNLSGDPDKILQDFVENKEKLNALVEEFTSSSAKLSLAEDIQHYLKMISEDLKLLNYSPDDVSEESLEDALEQLNEAIAKARAFKKNKKFSKMYNQIVRRLDDAEGNIKTLQVENAELLGKLESSKAEYSSLKGSLKNEKDLRIIAENELEKLKLEHISRIDIIEQALSQEEQNSRHKEIENFREIQKSQNLLISQLQAQNSEQALRIEQLNTDNSNLENSLNIEKSTIQNMQSELQARGAQLVSSEAFFEDFRRKIEIENNEQINNLRISQEKLQDEMRIMQVEREKLLESFNNCTQQLSEVAVEDRLKENVIKGLSNDIEHAGESIESAKSSRSQELEILEQTITDLKNTLAELQEQYDESLGKVLEQSNQIRELQEQISDMEYVSQRNLRG